jgi:hypothetical protein
MESGITPFFRALSKCPTYFVTDLKSPTCACAMPVIPSMGDTMRVKLRLIVAVSTAAW